MGFGIQMLEVIFFSSPNQNLKLVFFHEVENLDEGVEGKKIRK